MRYFQLKWLTYSALQVLIEGFYNLLTQQFKVTLKEAMKKIADVLKFVPVIEPDKKDRSSRIRLRKGNFLNITIKTLT